MKSMKNQCNAETLFRQNSARFIDFIDLLICSAVLWRLRYNSVLCIINEIHKKNQCKLFRQYCRVQDTKGYPRIVIKRIIYFFLYVRLEKSPQQCCETSWLPLPASLCPPRCTVSRTISLFGTFWRPCDPFECWSRSFRSRILASCCVAVARTL